ncbi:MAG: hypothetical protein VX588_07690 [Verrucomicrobiota bacterium]|nr:hypothetical protein [Verrucomicrobiota bacterium]
MAYQLIYTSVRRGLIPGRSGYTVAARHRQIRERLVSEIERVSGYSYAKKGKSPKIFAYRKFDISGVIYHVLTRIVDAGSDYTGRTNHLAHHLICADDELKNSGVTPAEILYSYDWLDRYEEEPRYLDDKEIVNVSEYAGKIKLPASNWKKIRGDAGDAALLVDGQGAAKSSIIVVDSDQSSQYNSLLPLIAESSQLSGLSGAGSSSVTFTTYFQEGESMADFDWIGCGEDNVILHKPTNREIFHLSELTQETPLNEIAKIAENGRSQRPSAPSPLTEKIKDSKGQITDTATASGVDVQISNAGKVNEGPQDIKEAVPRPTVLTNQVASAPAVSSFRADSDGLDHDPFWLKNLKLLIGVGVSVLVLVSVLLFYVLSYQPKQQMKINVDQFVAGKRYVEADNFLTEMLEEHPNWRDEIDVLRKEKVVNAMQDHVKNCINQFIGSSQDKKKDRYEIASYWVNKLEQFNFSSGSDEAKNREELIYNFTSGEERYKEQLRLANNRNENGPDEIIPNANKITKNESDDPELPVLKVPEENKYEPGSIYLYLNTGKINELILPESLRRLSDGEEGKLMVNVSRSRLASVDFPPMPKTGTQPFIYKYPETAEEENKRHLPISGDLNIELKFQGAGSLNLLRNDFQGTVPEDDVWRSEQSSLISFSEGRKGVDVILWNGRPFRPSKVPFKSDGKGVSLGPELKQFYKSLSVGDPSQISPQMAMISFTPISPPPGLKVPIESVRTDVSVRGRDDLYISFGKAAGGGLELLTKIEMQIDERKHIISKSGGDYLRWQESAAPYENKLKKVAIKLLGDRNDLLTRYRRVFDHDDQDRVRTDIRSYFVDLLEEFAESLRGKEVKRDDIEKIKEELCENEFPDQWDSRDVSSERGRNFTRFMEDFVEECEDLAKKSVFGRSRRDVKLSYYIESSEAREKIKELAKVLEDEFTDDPGEEFWDFTFKQKPKMPRNIKLIQKYQEEIQVLVARKEKAEIAMDTFSPIEGGQLPPGIYQFSLIFADGKIRPFLISEVEGKP